MYIHIYSNRLQERSYQGTEEEEEKEEEEYSQLKFV
jgi:hypothetical protein